MQWTQNYDPLGNFLLSALVAAAPIAVLLGLLLCGFSAPRAAIAGLITALLVSIAVFGMPGDAALAAAGFGACFGLLPIGWIVFSAVFLYHLTVRSGQFEVVKRSVAAISPDRRVQALLIAFSFGAFLEGAAGFGTPVAISAALLIGLRFDPLYAAGLALIANTSPVAFGALGTPIITLAKVAGLPGVDPADSHTAEMLLSQMAGRQLPVFSLIIPAWIVWVMSGWQGLKGCWPAVLVCGGSFAAIQFVTSNYHGPTLVDVLGGVGSLLATTVLLRFWQPKEIWRFPGEDHPNRQENSYPPGTHSKPLGPAEASAAPAVGQSAAQAERDPQLSAWAVAYAWMPWLVLSLVIFLWGWPPCKTFLAGGTQQAPNFLAGISRLTIEVPRLHKVVLRSAPVVDPQRAAEPEPAIYELNWLGATGTGIFLASVLAAVWLRLGPRVFFEELLRTAYRVRWAVLTIACMLAIAFTTRYSGTDATLGLAFTRTGWLYPLFAPMLGWLGVALTGSDTSSNALFGSLQRITAEQLGLKDVVVLIVASNSTGGVMGKMIDAQSIVVAAVATGQTGNEGQILRFVFLHSLILAFLIGLLTLAQAYAVPWMVPTIPAATEIPIAFSGL